MVSAFSIGTAKRSNDQKTEAHFTPGPGAYNPSKLPKKNPPQYKIGSSQRQIFIKNDAPGPGQYQNVRPSSTIKKEPIYSIGAKTYKETTQTSVPGPGQYNPNEIPKKSQPAFSFGLKNNLNNSSKSLIPGPGQYNPQNYEQITSRPTTKIGSAKRNNLEMNDSPGPGSYQVRRPASSGPQYRFGQDKRNYLNKELSQTPGPGTYHLKSTIDVSHGSTMVPRRFDESMRELMKIPGPGTYNPLKPRSKSGQRIGTSQREWKAYTQTPGPGQYNPFQKAKLENPQYRIGTAQRYPLSYTLDNPGPGTYRIPEKSIEGPKYTLTGRKFINNQNEHFPGPGTYNQTQNIGSQRYPSPIFGTSNRSTMHIDNIPGPGNYNLKSSITEGPKWGFGHQKREEQIKQTNNVGPGSYNIPSMVADVPKYLLNPTQTKK